MVSFLTSSLFCIIIAFIFFGSFIYARFHDCRWFDTLLFGIFLITESILNIMAGSELGMVFLIFVSGIMLIVLSIQSM